MDEASGAFAIRQWWLFPVLLLVVGLLLSVAIPPMQSPDEGDHLKRAYLLAHGQLLLDTPEGRSSGGMVDTGLLDYMRAHAGLPFASDQKVNAAMVDAARALQWRGEQEFSEAPGTGYYFPLIYAPHALGLLAGEVLGLSVDASYRLVRLLVLVCTVALLAWAFWLHGPPPLALGLLVLPMTLFQFASPTLDGLSAALAVLAISVFLKFSRDRDEAAPWLLPVLTVSVVILAASRVHLLPMLLLIFLCFAFVQRRGILLTGLGAVALVVGWLLLAVLYTVDTRVDTGAGTLTILGYYLADPVAFLRVLDATLSNDALTRFYRHSFLGILGWLDARFDVSVYRHLGSALLLLAFLSITWRGLGEDWLSRCALILCGVGGSMLVFLALLITWNAHPATLIEGVQGRYFLVPALLLAYALGGHATRGGGLVRLAGLGVVGGLLLFSAWMTLSLLLDRYYISPVFEPLAMLAWGVGA